MLFVAKKCLAIKCEVPNNDLKCLKPALVRLVHVY
jgi:hypothetical protein